MDAAGAALAVYLVGLATVAWLQPDERRRETIAALGLLVTAWAVARVLDGVDVVLGWSILIVVAFALWRGLRTVATVPRRVLDRSLGIAWTERHDPAGHRPGRGRLRRPAPDGSRAPGLRPWLGNPASRAVHERWDHRGREPRRRDDRRGRHRGRTTRGTCLAHRDRRHRGLPRAVPGRAVGRRGPVGRAGRPLGRHLPARRRRTPAIPGLGLPAGRRRRSGCPGSRGATLAPRRGTGSGRWRPGPAVGLRTRRGVDRVGNPCLGRPPACVGAVGRRRRGCELRVPGLDRRRGRGGHPVRGRGVPGGASNLGPGRTERALGGARARGVRGRPAASRRGAAPRRPDAAWPRHAQGVPG